MISHLWYKLFCLRVNVMFHIAVWRVTKKEHDMNIDFVKALLVSRKFWLALLGVIAAVVMFVQGGIDANALVDAIVVLVGLLIGSIAAEDVAAKLNR